MHLKSKIILILCVISTLFIVAEAGWFNRLRAKAMLKKLSARYEQIDSFESTVLRHITIVINNMYIGERHSISKLLIEKPNKLALLLNPGIAGIDYINDDSAEVIIYKLFQDSLMIFKHEPYKVMDSIVINIPSPSLEILILPYMFITNPYQWLMEGVIYPAFEKNDSTIIISLVQEGELFKFYLNRENHLINKIEYIASKDTEYGLIQVWYVETHENIKINEDEFYKKVKKFRYTLMGD